MDVKGMLDTIFAASLNTHSQIPQTDDLDVDNSQSATLSEQEASSSEETDAENMDSEQESDDSSS